MSPLPCGRIEPAMTTTTNQGVTGQSTGHELRDRPKVGPSQGFDPLAERPLPVVEAAPPQRSESPEGPTEGRPRRSWTDSVRPLPDAGPSPENRALLALRGLADPSGLVAGTQDSISEKVARLGGFEKTYQAEQAVKGLVSAKRIETVQGKGLRIFTEHPDITQAGNVPDTLTTEEHAPKPKKVTEKKPKKLPRTGLETRSPNDQNEHLWAAINSNRLSGSSQLVTMTANALLGAVSRGRKFGEVEREITADYMAAKTGLSARAARTALAEAVKAGFLVRLDQGKGGVAGRGKARYRAVLPVYGGISDGV